MTILLTIIITIICWQLVCTVVELIAANKLDDDNILRYIFSCGIWCLFVVLARPIIDKISLFCARKYNYYKLYGGYGKWLGNVYMTKEVADKYFTTHLCDMADPVPYSIRLYREGKDFKSAPNKSEILTADRIENSELFLAFSKEFKES